jgi:hypothetical protein
MKLHLIILLFFLNTIAQNNKDKDYTYYEKKWLEIGLEQLSKSEIELAVNAFVISAGFNIENDSISEYEILAKKKIDSLLPIIREKEKKKWIGKWKLQQLKNFKYNYDYIEFTDDKVFFYYSDSLNKPSRIEDIVFADYEKLEFYNSKYSLEFKNNEIWEFTFEKVKKEKRLKVYISRDNKKVNYFLLDERGIIREGKKRRKAYKEELLTYYILLE